MDGTAAIRLCMRACRSCDDADDVFVDETSAGVLLAWTVATAMFCSGAMNPRDDPVMRRTVLSALVLLPLPSKSVVEAELPVVASAAPGGDFVCTVTLFCEDKDVVDMAIARADDAKPSPRLPMVCADAPFAAPVTGAMLGMLSTCPLRPFSGMDSLTLDVGRSRRDVALYV